jgi:cytochrome c biogenesis protein
LPHHAAGLAFAGTPAEAGRSLHAGLRARRWRSAVREHPDGSVTVSAEKGYLKETGNLLMHFAMVAVLVGVAIGASYGWHGQRLVVAGPENAFCNVLQQYDERGLGTRVDSSRLSPPFCFTLTGFEAEYTEDAQALSFLARGEVTEEGPAQPVEFTVNSPLRLDGASVYLLANGYAPVLRYTDRSGASQTTTVPFLPNDPLGTAEGVARFPDANSGADGLQVAFDGLYLPTAPADGLLARSAHPEERDPVLWLRAWRGDLGLDDGTPQSVWDLPEAQIASGELQQVGEPGFLLPGESMTLDDGTTVEFLGTERWVTVSVRHDPGQPIVLGGAIGLLAGLVLSLTGHRRRVWFRIGADSRVEAGGLPRSEYPGFADEFATVVASAGLVEPERATAGRST